MRGTNVRTAISGALVCVTALGLSAAEGGTRRAAGSVQAGEILGFDVAEERHYALGPPEALARGELATWMIRLDAVAGAGRNRRATFTLQHRREAPSSLEDPPTPGEVTIAQVDGTLVVNSYGAPLEATYTSQRHIYDVGDELFEVGYVYDGDHYKKRVSLQGTKWDLDVDFIEHAGLDATVPIGVISFAPRSIDCFEWLAGTVIERRAGTGDTGPERPVRSAERQGTATIDDAALAAGACYERNTDPAFANPGLLSLGMALLWERRGNAELVLFSPLRPDLVRGQSNGIPVTFAPIIPNVPLVPGSSILTGMIPGLDLSMMLGGGGTDGDKERARDPRRYFTPSLMQLSDRQRIDVGARKMDALPVQMSGFAGTAWVDDWGKVLRMDLPPIRFDDAPRHVRLLHSSEH